MILGEFDPSGDRSREPDPRRVRWLGWTLLLAAAILAIAAIGFLLFGLVAVFYWTASADREHRFVPFYLSIPLVLAACLALWLSWHWHFRPTRFLRSARKLWGKADQEDPAAWTRLGRSYLEGGDGLAKDEASARFWLEKAVQAKDPEAMSLLADLLRNGDGGPRHPRRAAAIDAELADIRRGDRPGAP